MILSTPFQQSDLNANKQFVLTHNLNTNVIAPVYIDNTGINQTTVGLFAFGDENGNDQLNKCTLSLNSDITGIHVLELVYTSSIEQLNGKRLFEQSTIPSSTPNLNDRFALGRAGIACYNMTIGALISFLGTNTGLGSIFLKKADNLAGLNNTTALNNLGAPSLSYVNNQLSQKAGIFQPASGAALGIANALEYTPASSYNPATKKYVDDHQPILCIGLLTDETSEHPTISILNNYSGITPVFTCNRLADGFYQINHNLGANYMSMSEAKWDGNNPIYPTYVSKSLDANNQFHIFCGMLGSSADTAIKFILFRGI